MTDRKQSLTELLAKVEAGVKYETMGHTRLCQRAFPKPDDFDGSRKAYSKSAVQQAILVWRNGSLDAAKALHEKVLGDDWHWSIFSGESCVYKMDHPHSGNSFRAKTGNYSRDWLTCILSVLIAQEDAQ